MEKLSHPLLAITILAAVVLGARDAAAQSRPPDFNGDGFSDLAAGVPNEGLEATAMSSAGAVSVIYGTPTGLSSTNNQLWTQDSPGILEDAETGDQFGTSVAHGDFNGDGFSDLAVGAPLEDLGTVLDAGAVNVIYGSALGLTSVSNQVWHQNSRGVPGTPADGDRFGWSVASGDFNDDGFDDLAVGVIGDLVMFQTTPVDNAGSVNVLYGSASGLVRTNAQIFNEKALADNPKADDLFGWSLTTGDYDGDGFDELIMGVPFEDTAKLNTGIVYRLVGSAAGLVRGNPGFQFFLQGHKNVPDINCPLPDIKESCQEIEDQWGYAVSTGDYNADGFDDFAVGVPGEEYGPVINIGQVQVLYGSSTGPVRNGSQIWNQDQPDVLDQGERGDRFGRSLASGDFDGDGFDDLAIGIPMEALDETDATKEAGVVQVLYGSTSKLTTARQQLWSQDTGTIEDSAERLDQFGVSLSVGDFDGDGRSDLAVGVSEDVPGDAGNVVGAGAANVLYGFTSGLSGARNQFWHQDSPGILDTAEADDLFGTALPAF